MGSHSSKAPKGDVVGQQHPAEAAAGAASPSKANGQENGHVKINGDVSPKADGEAAPLNGNGSAEPVKEEPKAEAGSGDAIEPAPVAEGADSKAETTAAAGASKETPKKKKKFSFKKSFKLSGISFRKTKKDAGDASAVTSPSEEQGKAETKGEENPACAVAETGPASTTKEEAPEEKAVAPVDAAPAVEAPQEAEAPREEGSPGQEPPEEEKQQPAEAPEEDRKPEETSKPGEAEPSPAPGLPETKEE